jgi:outer membrane murein-binding lipoprotein Lpp
LRFNLSSFIISAPRSPPYGGFLNLGDQFSGGIFFNLLLRIFAMKIKAALQGSVLALAIVVASGCVSTSKFDELSARVDRIASDVAANKSAADAASAAAASAQQTAAGAQSAANQALNAANQAQSCCDANSEKMDRMFQRSQSK